MFLQYDSVPSTMDTARELLREGKVTFFAGGQAEPAGILAKEQTAGRGQRGRVWFAAPEESLCLTLFFRRSTLTTPANIGKLSFLAGVSVAEALKAAALPPQTAPFQRGENAGKVSGLGIKWPNDIQLNGRKLGGILIEQVNNAGGESVVLIGIGVNLTAQDFPLEIAETATSLAREGLEAPSPVALAERIVICMEHWAACWQEEGFPVLLERWREWDVTAGRRFTVEGDGQLLLGTAMGVDEDGQLRLRLDSGETIATNSATHLRDT